MKPIVGRFQEVEFDSKEVEHAIAVNPYTYAYINNKAASYANAVLDFEYDSDKSLQQQIIEHEKLKACVLVLEELLRELKVPTESNQSQT